MIISRKKNPPQPLVPLHLKGESLELVTSFKYLGIHISHDLSWSDHVQHVSTKARKIIGQNKSMSSEASPKKKDVYSMGRGLHMIIYYHCNSDNALLLSFLLTCHPAAIPTSPFIS